MNHRTKQSIGIFLTNYRFLPLTTKYWKPSDDYLTETVAILKGKLKDNDIIVFSEKAISTATGNIIDEQRLAPSMMARILAKFWMKYAWAYIFGPLCNFNEKTIRNIRQYPEKEGAAHKEAALIQSNFLQALQHGSEGGIDASNLPYSYVSLPLPNPQRTAENIAKRIKTELVKNITVVIADTDKTYSWHNFHFTPRSSQLNEVNSSGGIFAYLIGRVLKLTRRATPLAVAGKNSSIEEILTIAEYSNRIRGFGSGRTVWDMAEKFQVGPANVSWEMLEKIEHKPIVIVRPIN
jgi:F420-0:gamma-glutamyl ligase-like protein